MNKDWNEISGSFLFTTLFIYDTTFLKLFAIYDTFTTLCYQII